MPKLMNGHKSRSIMRGYAITTSNVYNKGKSIPRSRKNVANHQEQIKMVHGFKDKMLSYPQEMRGDSEDYILHHAVINFVALKKLHLL